jgi:hypothetical protein
MICHASDSANPHRDSQVPNGLLPRLGSSRLSNAMADDFRRALLRHMDQHQTSMAVLSRATGVSLDVLKKLKTRATGSTTVENALLISAFYGKTVNQFIAGEDVSQADKLANLLQLLTPAERQLVEAQMLGLIAAHERQ